MTQDITIRICFKAFISDNYVKALCFSGAIFVIAFHKLVKDIILYYSYGEQLHNYSTCEQLHNYSTY